jgi:hypothetical protein
MSEQEKAKTGKPGRRGVLWLALSLSGIVGWACGSGTMSLTFVLLLAGGTGLLVLFLFADPPEPRPLHPKETPQSPRPAAAPEDLKARIDFMWEVHKYINEDIRFADAKAALAFGASSAMLGVLLKEGLEHPARLSMIEQSISGMFPVLTSLAYLALAALFSCLALLPRLQYLDLTRSEQRDAAILVFWHNIARGDRPGRVSILQQLSPAEQMEHLTKHVVDISWVANYKYQHASFALGLMLGGGACFLLSVVCWSAAAT